jgi:uncharacterized protein (TIGR02246 family)
MKIISNRMRVVSVAAIVLIIASSVSAQQREARTAVEAGNKRFSEALKRGDAQGLTSLYTKDAMVFPANSEIVKGREAIKGMWDGVIAAGIKGITLTTVEVESCGDIANEVGTYTMMGEGDKELDRGKYIVVWKREDGQWKLHRDIFNTSNPTPAR